MGNSASIPKVNPTAPLPDDLFKLSDRHLKLLWEDRPLSLNEIQHAAKSLPTSSVAGSSEDGDDDVEDPEFLSGLHYFRNSIGDDEESPESKLAGRLCQVLNELALIRFRLVPTRVKEDKFWIATLMLLKDRLVEYNASRDPSYKEILYSDGDDDAVVRQTNGKATKTTVNGNSSRHLERQVQVQKVQIAKLERQIQKLEAALAAASANSGKPDTKSKPSKEKAAPTHKGSWQIHPDSKEFLQYPEEVKQSLRAEKQRRLEQVRQEINFILDSDEIHHTNGKWDCCNEQSYHASCSM